MSIDIDELVAQVKEQFLKEAVEQVVSQTFSSWLPNSNTKFEWICDYRTLDPVLARTWSPATKDSFKVFKMAYDWETDLGIWYDDLEASGSYSRHFLGEPPEPPAASSEGSLDDGGRYPHSCPRCGGPAYVGLNDIDCKGGC